MFLSPLLESGERVHRLENQTRGCTLARRIETAFDSRSRRKGLLGRDGLDAGSALIIAPCNGVHTLFMRFPIDVVFAAKDGRVVKISHDVVPWRLSLALRGFATVELPAGTVRSSGTNVGDRLVVLAEPEA